MHTRILPIARVRQELASLIRTLQDRPEPIFVTQRGEAKAVILGVESYDALVERLEFLEDSLEAAERVAEGEPGAVEVEWDEYKSGRRGNVSGPTSAAG